MMHQHLRVVHGVNMIAAPAPAHGRKCVAVDDVDVLVKGVGCSAIPVLAHALLRGIISTNSPISAYEIPGLLKMTDQRMGFILRQDTDAAQARN